MSNGGRQNKNKPELLLCCLLFLRIFPRRITDFGIDDDYSELVRAASVRSLGHKNEIDMLIQEKLKQGGLPKSSSVGMARIDEEGEAEEGSVNTKTKKVSDLYPCSKSYAVTGSPKF
ncbi:hypothetical protein YC2023_100524 [Brassica napus]